MERRDDAAIEAMIHALLDRRQPDATICPSEVAKALHGDGDDAWRPAMPGIRHVAAALAAEGRLRVTRAGRDVDALAAGGPIRLGRPSIE